MRAWRARRGGGRDGSQKRLTTAVPRKVYRNTSQIELILADGLTDRRTRSRGPPIHTVLTTHEPVRQYRVMRCVII